MKSQKGRPHPDKEVGVSLRYHFLFSQVLQSPVVFISTCFVQVSIFSFRWHSLNSCLSLFKLRACMLGSSDRIQNIGSTKSFSTRSTKVHLAYSLEYLFNTLLHVKSTQIYIHPKSPLPGGTENVAATKISRTFQVEVPEGSGDEGGKAAEGYKKALGSMFDAMVPLKKGKQAESDSDDGARSGRRRRNNSTTNSTSTKDPKAGF